MNKKRVSKILLYSLGGFIILVLLAILGIVLYYSSNLPNYKNLKNYDPATTTRLYSSNGKYLKEYAKEKRLFVPIEQIPDLLKNAFISAEDSSFYEHSGINPAAILGAAFDNLIGKITNTNKLRGGSTITQQVAKNFLLTNEKTFSRKIKEAILSVRMTEVFSKNQILELYLNQIFLGNRSYGVASASLNYFNKSLDELNIDEVALLASLPKAPTKLDPTKNSQGKILDRRNWVINRMYELGYISKDNAEIAKNKPIVLKEKKLEEVSNGEFFSEEVRKDLVKLYGEEKLLEAGNVVLTTIDQNLQLLAEKYLQNGIENYDKKHGFRGAIDNLKGEIDFKNRWGTLIDNYKLQDKIHSTWKKAVVLDINEITQEILIGLGTIEYDEKLKQKLEENKFVTSANDNKLLLTGYIPIANCVWAKKYISVDEIGIEPLSVLDLELKVGDVIIVRENLNVPFEYFLEQIPAVNGALLAMNPHNGEILAMMGGYIDSQVDFNRATQAERQPGSVLKPFAYLAALENNYTPASIINDEEIELDQGLDKPPYKPRNFENVFYGPTTLRLGLEKSRNVATVRLAADVGLSKVTEVIRRFGINRRPRKIYSIVLGSTETNLLKMVRAYGMIVNGGKEIKPTLIQKIQDKNGKIIFKHTIGDCINCNIDKTTNISELIVPTISDKRKTITDSATAYQMTNLLEGVVNRGTAWRAKAIKRSIGAKTGTTNDSNDAWFIGFSPDLVVGVYVGFDKPNTLGKNETGSSVAGPIFMNFMKDALKNTPSIPFRVPSSVSLIKIDTKTGYYPTPDSNSKDIVLEAFKINDKIVKFEEEITDDDISDYMQNNEQSERPLIIINIQEKPEKDEEFIKEMDNQNYDVDFTNKVNSPEIILNEQQENEKKSIKIYKLKEKL